MHSPSLTATHIAVTALSDRQLLQLAGETAITEFGLVARDTLPWCLANEVHDLLDDVRNDRIEAALVEDDPEQAPQARLRVLRERLRRVGRGLLAGTANRPGPLGLDEHVLVLAFPTGARRRADVVVALEAA